MKRFLIVALFACVFFPSVFAQSGDLIKYEKEVFKTFLTEKLKKEKSLNLDEAQLELLGYKLVDYFAEYAKKQSFSLTQQQISSLQDSTKTLSGLRKEMNKQSKTLEEKQAKIGQLNDEVQNLKQQREALQETAQQLRGYKDAAGQMDDLKNQLQTNKDEYAANLKQAAEDHDRELAALKEKHNQEVAELGNQLKVTQDELSDQKERVNDLQSKITDLNQLLDAKNEELKKWQGGVESVLAAIENQCFSIKENSLAAMDPVSFQSSFSSFEGMRPFVQAIDPQRVSAIDDQIKDVSRIMDVGRVFKEAFSYIQGRQDSERAKVLTDQLNKVRHSAGLSRNQGDEIDKLVTALDNQGPLYSHFRSFLSQLCSKSCLPTKAKIDEQLGLIDNLVDIDGFLLMPDYHKTYMDAVNKLKDTLQKAANNDRKVAPIVKDEARFPGMIDEIINML